MTAQKPLTGRIAPDRIHMHATPKPPAGAVDRFLALGPCSGTISDIMDELQIPAGGLGVACMWMRSGAMRPVNGFWAVMKAS